MKEVVEQIHTVMPVVLFLAYVIMLISNWIQFRRIKYEVKELKVVIKDTDEIRTALLKPLEGTWSVAGDFPLYKGEKEYHHTTGEAIFNWVPTKNSYEVRYIYITIKESQETDLITCFSKGALPAKADGCLPSSKVSIQLEIIGRSAVEEVKPSLKKTFLLQGEVSEDIDGRPVCIKFEFGNKDTNGSIQFTR